MKRLAVLVGSLLVLGAAPGASADTVSLPDPAGDATWFRFDLEPKPCGTLTTGTTPRNDVRRLVVTHTRYRVTLTARVTDMTPARKTFGEFRVVTPRRAWDLSVDYFPGGPAEVSLAPAQRRPEPMPDTDCSFVVGDATYSYCNGATAAIDRAAGLVRASLPRRCLRTPGWVRAGATVQGFVDDTNYVDHWAPPGRTEGDGWDPVLTPAVRVDAPAR